MVLQMAELPDVASEVQVSANGHGSALLQVTARYNVKSEAREKSFMLNVTIVEETQNFLKLRIYMSYLKGKMSGMALLQVQVPGGFEAELQSLKDNTLVKKVEMKKRIVNIYFDSIPGDPIVLYVDVPMSRNDLVGKTQPATVKIIDYYSPGNEVLTTYQSSILNQLEVCDLCGKDCKIC
ncbi:CD109 antigen-like [Lingula anatina]|uniref:CD109 antigen-like n=1 Tax=Lingula anatina TaxID=7574 RepID=A0A1S3HU02_LINAN|nr:CD109 antigen-like [Lingula anatina]|eukprot:XP_013389525.1 CD109 antigen-like [Lingula anatina]